MFPNSKIVSQEKACRTNYMYTINFGLTQYFREILYDETVAFEWHSISFDESLNEVVLEFRMCIIGKFLDNISNDVQVQFWNSMFLGQSTSRTLLLLKHVTDGLSGLDPTKNALNSIDGPKF